MDMGTFAAAQQSLGALFSLARGASAAVLDHEVKTKLIDIQAAVLDVQGKLGDAQREQLDLLQELAEVKERLRAAEARRDTLDSYQLVSVEPGSLLYRSKEGVLPEHYACPTCYNKGELGVLRAIPLNGGSSTSWHCAACGFAMRTGAPPPPMIRRTAHSPGIF